MQIYVNGLRVTRGEDKVSVFRLAFMLTILPALLIVSVPSSADCVVVLHGLMRTSKSMAPIAASLAERGYVVINVDYPSRKDVIERLAPLAVEKGIAQCPGEQRIHFVSHSLGGVLIREYLEHHDLHRLGRVVMLAPPNHGSEIVDRLKGVPGFSLVTGPAGYQLGTNAYSVPLRLGRVDFELGVIAGTGAALPFLSAWVPDEDDGLVSVASAKVPGMTDFIEVHRSHAFIMNAPEVFDQTAAFIESGRFKRADL